MTSSTYVRYEVLRNFRNWRFFMLTLTFPLVIYLIITRANQSSVFNGIPFKAYFMVAMATLGTMASAVSIASVISAERSSGWTRQMRITPLRKIPYFGAKMLNGYLRALLTLVVAGLAGTLFGVRLPAHEWLTVLGLLLAGLIPFTVLGILLGHVISSDASAPAVGGIVTVFALLGGVYGFQVAQSGAMLQFLKALPSYWLVQADKTTIGSGAWPAEAWIVIASWTVALSLTAVLVYRRDTSRT